MYFHNSAKNFIFLYLYILFYILFFLTIFFNPH